MWEKISTIVYLQPQKLNKADKQQLHLHKGNSSGNCRSIIRPLCLLLQQPLSPSMLICRFALTQFSPLQTQHAKEDACGIDLEVFLNTRFTI